MVEVASPFEAFEEAVRIAGGQAPFARLVGCTQGNISQLLKNKRPLSPRYVRKAEEVTGVPKEALRPDLYPPDFAAPVQVPVAHEQFAGMEPNR
jgi:DNA-binding transcriptional regulator YdaS (Cro superfamily)